jgi:hypothetical protein
LLNKPARVPDTTLTSCSEVMQKILSRIEGMGVCAIRRGCCVTVFTKSIVGSGTRKPVKLKIEHIDWTLTECLLILLSIILMVFFTDRSLFFLIAKCLFYLAWVVFQVQFFAQVRKCKGFVHR